MIKANYADTTHFYVSLENMPATISELQLLAFRLLEWFENNHVKTTQLIFFVNKKTKKLQQCCTNLKF